MPANVQTLELKKTGMLSGSDDSDFAMMMMTRGDFSFRISLTLRAKTETEAQNSSDNLPS